MDREYLEDYEQTEREEFERLVGKTLEEGSYSFENDRYPPNERFVNLKKPVAKVSWETMNIRNIWGQIPFSGSLILPLGVIPKRVFERTCCRISEIPKIIDFIKNTGRLQVALNSDPTMYTGLDYLDPFFDELRPPELSGIPFFTFWSRKEIKEAQATFDALAMVKYYNYGIQLSRQFGSIGLRGWLEANVNTYVFLKLARYTIAEAIENLMIESPERVVAMLIVCQRFIVNPFIDLRSDQVNFSLEGIKTAKLLPSLYQPRITRFPFEIGQFLLKKLTYTPQGIRACYDILDHYTSYDLQRVQESLNEAIVTNNPDVINQSVQSLSEILDNVWNDKTIPKRIENIKVGVPVSIAAIGGVAGGLMGGLAGAGTGGFLAELGFKIGEKAVEKFFNTKGTGLSEKLAKLRTKSYQANVYDFKKKYKHRIVRE